MERHLTADVTIFVALFDAHRKTERGCQLLTPAANQILTPIEYIRYLTDTSGLGSGPHHSRSAATSVSGESGASL